ncbi:MAG: helix-turn-helix domain-containing protein [Candidatus Eremiobacteraeota bacterium]|nr:helix-turn-helix domain-containing protein [Candidatus Eremiobacteraeota bacterium]
MASKVKKPSLADALLHPQRLEIVRMLAIHGPQSVRELATRLPAIAQATLYRQVKVLQSAGAMMPSGKRMQQWGAPETVYGLVEGATTSLRLKSSQRSPESMRRYFAAVQAALWSAFERRLNGGPIASGELAVRHSVVYLNADELREVKAIFARLKELEIDRGGRRRLFSLSLALFPEPKTSKK